ncbi:MAG: sulfite oxidase-like oxidoreductase [Firmicutes bacterium]|nr:sulfite oxidase-like oxidoreductase [Bacillota bacterium]
MQDDAPAGAAEGRPRIPPGQYVTQRWPVLHYGDVPKVDLATWRFRITGLVEDPCEWTYEEIRAMPARTITRDIHCVTRWSRLDATFTGVPVRDLVARARVKPEGRFVIVHAEEGWTTNLPVEDLLREDNLLAWAADGEELTPEHGWPLRLVVPHLYFWKSAKWVRGFEFVAEDVPGFWERYGYHMRGDPWKEQRFQ